MPEKIANGRGSGEEMLPGNEIFRVGDEFRISAGAEFVEVQSLALSFDRYPVGVYAVEKPIQAIGERQHEAQQRRHADQLGQQLSRIARSRRQRSCNIRYGSVEAAEQPQRQ